MKYTDEMITEATRIVKEKLALIYPPEMLEKCGIDEARITPAQWLRIGVPTTFFSLVPAGLYHPVTKTGE